MTVIADTSVWIGHLRSGDVDLSAALEDGLVVMHPFIAGELACGNLAWREAFLSGLSALPRAVVVPTSHFVEKRRLWGRGLGWVDAHLLASAFLVSMPFVDAGLCIAQSRGGIGCGGKVRVRGGAYRSAAYGIAGDIRQARGGARAV